MGCPRGHFGTTIAHLFRIIRNGILVNAVEFVNDHDMRGAWYASSWETDQVCDCMDHIKVTFVWADLLTLRDHIHRLLEVTILHSEVKAIRSTSLPGASTNLPNFINILLSVRHRACTDPRDKIFGMLSLVKDWASRPSIKADYSKGGVTVFTEVAAQMIGSDYGARTLLPAQGLDPVSRASAGLPTWVPDWTKSGTRYDKYLLDIDTAVSQDSQPPVILGSTLALHGLSRAKITRISTAGSPPSSSNGFPLAETFEDRKVFAGSLESWRDFAGVKNSLSLQGVLNRCLFAPEHTREMDPQAESRSYARLMTDIKRSDHTVDFPSYVTDFFAVILEYQEDLRRMEPDEEAFYRTLLHDTYPLRLQLPQYHKEALCILRILLILMLSCVDPDRLLTRLNMVVLTKINETLGNPSDVSETAVPDGQPDA